MDYIPRTIEPSIKRALARNKSILLLGARQTGKTTLIQQLEADHGISFIQSAVRLRYEQNPSLLIGEIEALAEKLGKIPTVVIDEVQKVPDILDEVQDLIDRKIAQFILTGSSARKLRLNKKINLLPGRVVIFRLEPLMLNEIKNFSLDITHLLLNGSLPGIFTLNNQEFINEDLSSYVTTYLEEEIRAEALVRNVGTFSRFLSLAAAESGSIINLRKLSQEIGVAHTTIEAYFQILEDCLVADRIEPYYKTKVRRRLTKTPKYLFFDLGIRRLAAEEGIHLPEKYMGQLFEQWVGLELLRMARVHNKTIKIYFWRDPDGPEIDWVILKNNQLTPIEVKWTNKPSQNDIKYLKLFLTEYDNVEKAYLVCQTPQKIKLDNKIYAIPWQELTELGSWNE